MADVVVIGGGFAGLTAARELGRRGYEVVLLEARERLGGRTWTAPFSGVDVEMGGAFVHRTQPHVWAELTRYGIGVVELPDAEESFLRTDNGIVELDRADWDGLLEAFAQVCRDAAELIPDPMVVPSGPAAEAADRQTLADRLSSADLRPLERDLLDAIGAGMNSTTNDRVGALWGVLKACALAGYRVGAMLEVNARWGIEGGTAALMQAIAADAPAVIRLGTAAASVVQEGGSVVVTTVEGEELRGRAAIVALPVNALGRVAFEPALSELKREAAELGMASLGHKWWLRLRTKVASVSAAAPDRYPISFLETALTLPDGASIALAFGPSAAALPLSEPAAIAKAVEDLLPGAEVEEVGGHDWVADPFAGQTWATYPPGTYTRWAPALERREGRVVFAGGDFARGWAGYIDGAIETGLRAAREVGSLLG